MVIGIRVWDFFNVADPALKIEVVEEELGLLFYGDKNYFFEKYSSNTKSYAFAGEPVKKISYDATNGYVCVSIAQRQAYRF